MATYEYTATSSHKFYSHCLRSGQKELGLPIVPTLDDKGGWRLASSVLSDAGNVVIWYWEREVEPERNAKAPIIGPDPIIQHG